jgi:hypothetical protein
MFPSTKEKRNGKDEEGQQKQQSQDLRATPRASLNITS